MIHCVNLNSTQDLLVECSSIRLGEVFRADSARVYPGGKGCNVARTVGLLGGRVRLVGLCGRGELKTSGPFFRSFGVRDRRREVEGLSRTCLVLKDRRKDQETVINTPSRLVLKAPALGLLLRDLGREIKPGDWVTVSGSVPFGLPRDSLARLAKAAAAKGARVIVDSSGQGLKLALAGLPYIIKPNQAELAGLLGQRRLVEKNLPGALAPLFRKGIKMVVVTLGSEGSLALWQGGRLKAAAPRVKGRPLFPLGCGDAYLGGLVWALDTGKTLAQALRWATAAATANLCKPGASFMSKKDVAFWMR